MNSSYGVIGSVHNETPAPVSHVRIMFPAEQKSVLIRCMKLEIQPSLRSMANGGEAHALVQFLALPCWLPVAT